MARGYRKEITRNRKTRALKTLVLILKAIHNAFPDKISIPYWSDYALRLRTGKYINKMKNTKEFLENIKSCKTAEEFLQLMKDCSDLNAGFDFEKSRAYLKKSLRAEIKAFSKENDVSLYQLSQLIDIDYNNFLRYMKGARPLPYEKVEEILAILSVAKL